LSPSYSAVATMRRRRAPLSSVDQRKSL